MLGTCCRTKCYNMCPESQKVQLHTRHVYDIYSCLLFLVSVPDPIELQRYKVSSTGAQRYNKPARLLGTFPLLTSILWCVCLQLAVSYLCMHGRGSRDGPPLMHGMKFETSQQNWIGCQIGIFVSTRCINKLYGLQSRWREAHIIQSSHLSPCTLVVLTIFVNGTLTCQSYHTNKLSERLLLPRSHLSSTLWK